MYVVRSLKQVSATLAMALLVIAPLVSACERTPTEIEPFEAVGTYTMVAINGQPLPALFKYDESYDTQYDYISGQLVLRADSTFSNSYTVRVTKGTLGGRTQLGAKTNFFASGSYRVVENSIVFQISSFNGQPQNVEVPAQVLGTSEVRMPTHATVDFATYRKRI